MSTLTVSLKLPRDLLGALDIPEAQLETRILELVALELFRQDRISTGKGARIISRVDSRSGNRSSSPKPTSPVTTLANAGPLIALAQIGQFNLLQKLYLQSREGPLYNGER